MISLSSGEPKNPGAPYLKKKKKLLKTITVPKTLRIPQPLETFGYTNINPSFYQNLSNEYKSYMLRKQVLVILDADELLKE